jgi:hypothetical protein
MHGVQQKANTLSTEAFTDCVRKFHAQPTAWELFALPAGANLSAKSIQRGLRVSTVCWYFSNPTVHGWRINGLKGEGR